ncbi:unnamed protein product [Allacma fusca]|uniref:CRAL-TRIO domain-containing protein n=1 Tax=Allacma fusca TaxID=39272 RepID=A0A8J2NY10_9HEXA|nr:unnamed protein product [Allacma fusca]
MLTKLILFLAICAGAQSLGNSTGQILLTKFELSKPQADLSMEVHKKIYSYTKNTKFFKNFTFEQTVDFMNELNAWQPSQDITENFPYANWGYDSEKRPVWAQEIGRQNWRRIVEQGQERTDMLERYLLKCVIPVVTSLVAADSPGEEIRHGVFIWDMEGFDMTQLGHLPSLSTGVKLAIKYGDLAQGLAGKAFLINSNYVTKLAADIARPLLGNLLEKVEVYGTNRNIWLPRLLKTIPESSIPPWYGGSKSFKPLGVFG